MKLRELTMRSVLLSMLLFSMGVAGDGHEDVVITPFGDASVQVGQVVNGYYQSQGSPILAIYNIWQQQAYAHIGFDALIDKRLDINISVGGSMVYSDPQVIADPATLKTSQQFLINSAYAMYPFIRKSNLFSLTLQGGYFPYKYNPDVRNLGGSKTGDVSLSSGATLHNP